MCGILGLESRNVVVPGTAEIEIRRWGENQLGELGVQRTTVNGGQAETISFFEPCSTEARTSLGATSLVVDPIRRTVTIEGEPRERRISRIRILPSSEEATRYVPIDPGDSISIDDRVLQIREGNGCRGAKARIALVREPSTRRAIVFSR